MNNNEWITDRLPTPQDGDYYGQVWDSTGSLSFTHEIAEGEPWMPSNCVGMYVKPKRFTTKYCFMSSCWAIYYDLHIAQHLRLLNDPNSSKECEAAERIAAIYEEMMP